MKLSEEKIQELVNLEFQLCMFGLLSSVMILPHSVSR
jgi:hypothetical protein